MKKTIKKTFLLTLGLLLTACGDSSSTPTTETKGVETSTNIEEPLTLNNTEGNSTDEQNSEEQEREETTSVEESSRQEPTTEVTQVTETINSDNIFVLEKIAVDTALNSVIQNQLGYTFELRTDGIAPTTTAQSSIAIWGKTSETGATIINLEVHNGYATDTNFQVVVKEGNKIIGSSELLNFSAGMSDIEYGVIPL